MSRDLHLKKTKNDKVVVPIIISLSIAVPLAVAVLLLYHQQLHVDFGINGGTLPAFHAILNGSTAILLLLGLWFIKNKKINAHRSVMLTAFGFSAIFLISYVISKLNAEPVHYGGDLPYLYYFILITHILLSIPVLPLAMFAIYRGLNAEYNRHRKIVRWTFPIWLYVAITGVLVYLFMAPYY